MRIEGVPFLYPLTNTQPGDVSGFLRGLAVGQMLDAELVQQREDGTTLIRLGGRLLLAECQAALDLEVPFRVQVTSIWPQVHLQALLEGVDPTEFLRRSLWKALPLIQGDAAQGLWDNALEEWRVLEPALLARHGGPEDLAMWTDPHTGRPGLRTYLEASGLLLEPKLAGLVEGYSELNGPWPDLKASLLQILQAMGEQEGKSSASRSVLDLLQGCQSMSLLVEEGGTHLYLPLILWGSPWGGWGDLRIRREGGRGHRGRPWTITLRLDLKSMGRIHANMALHNGAFSCWLRASQPAVRGLLQSGIPALERRLLALGIPRVRCECGQLEDASAWDCPLEDLPAGLMTVRA
jgi:hypothetical protein